MTVSRCVARRPSIDFQAQRYFVSTVDRDEAVIREQIKSQEQATERLEQLAL